MTMQESDKVALARLDERLEQQMRTLFGLVKEIQSTQSELTTKMTKVDGRLDNVENALSRAQPTLNDYIEVKHKIVGVGRAGTYIWSAFVGILSVAIFFKDTIFGWFSK